MLLHLGHGSILSGFLGVFSSKLLVSLCSPCLVDLTKDVSLSAEGVLGFSKTPEDAEEDFNSSVL